MISIFNQLIRWGANHQLISSLIGILLFIIIFRKGILKIIKTNTLLLSILATFGVGLIGVVFYCVINDKFLKDIALSDWLSYFAGSATVGGLVYVFIDKVSSEKENRHVKWQAEIPFLSLASPCDPTLAYCDINILNDIDNPYGRGKEYFSIVNLGKLNAYDITIEFSYDNLFSNVFYQHYIDHISPLLVFCSSNVVLQQPIQPTGNINYSANYPVFSYQFREAVYSKYRVDPNTKEVFVSEFDLCGCTNAASCTIINATTNEKKFYARIIYYSSYARGWRYKIESNYRVYIQCSQQPGNANASQLVNSVVIKGIVLDSYTNDFIKS